MEKNPRFLVTLTKNPETLRLAKYRSSCSEMFCKIGVLKNFAKFTEKHLCQSLFFNKDSGLGLQRYEKRDSGTGVFL